MSVILNDSIQLHAPKPLEDWRGIWENGVFRPYHSIAEANATIPPDYRHAGLTVLIDDTDSPSGFSEWWYAPDLIPNP